MNKVILSGRLVKDPEVRYSQNDNKAIARMSIAVDRRYRSDNSEQTADFINLISFGKQAEFFEKYGRKGVKFNIVGRIQTGSYTNQAGAKVYTTDVVVEECEFAESKSNGSSNTSSPADSQPAAPDEMMNIPDGIDEELPFN